MSRDVIAPNQEKRANILLDDLNIACDEMHIDDKYKTLSIDAIPYIVNETIYDQPIDIINALLFVIIKMNSAVSCPLALKNITSKRKNHLIFKIRSLLNIKNVERLTLPRSVIASLALDKNEVKSIQSIFDDSRFNRVLGLGRPAYQFEAAIIYLFFKIRYDRRNISDDYTQKNIGSVFNISDLCLRNCARIIMKDEELVEIIETASQFR